MTLEVTVVAVFSNKSTGKTKKEKLTLIGEFSSKFSMTEANQTDKIRVQALPINFDGGIPLRFQWNILVPHFARLTPWTLYKVI